MSFKYEERSLRKKSGDYSEIIGSLFTKRVFYKFQNKIYIFFKFQVRFFFLMWKKKLNKLVITLFIYFLAQIAAPNTQFLSIDQIIIYLILWTSTNIKCDIKFKRIIKI